MCLMEQWWLSWTQKDKHGVARVTENKLAVLKTQTVLNLSAPQRAQGFKLHEHIVDSEFLGTRYFGLKLELF